jgi:hypothetical protein
MALAMAQIHLTAGHDVVAPQMVLQAEFVDQLTITAMRSAASFHEVVLWAHLSAAERRFNQRVNDHELSAHHRDA